MSHSSDYYAAENFHGDPGIAWANRMADEMLGIDPPDEWAEEMADTETVRPLRAVPGPESAGERPDGAGEGADTGTAERWTLDDARAAVIGPWAAARLAVAVKRVEAGKATGMTKAIERNWGAAAPVFCWARYLGGIGYYPAAELESAAVADALVTATRDGDSPATDDALRAAAAAGWADGAAEPLLALGPEDSPPLRNGRPAPVLPSAEQMAKVADGRGCPDPVDALITYARERWSFGCDDQGRTYAVPRTGPRVIEMIGERSPFRRRLVGAYYAEHHRTFGAETVSKALEILRDEAEQAEPRPLYLRAAPWGDGVVIDLGARDGRLVEVSPDGWRVVEAAEAHPLFRRPGDARPLPEPSRHGDLKPWADLLGLDEDSAAFRFLVGWQITLVASPGQDAPVVWLAGPKGSFKTTRARLLTGVLDPALSIAAEGQGSPLPKSTEDMVVAAASQFVCTFDNVTTISQRQNDDLCRLVSGTRYRGRERFSDTEAVSVHAQRPVVITTLQVPTGAREDLLDRSGVLPSEHPDDRFRRTPADLDEMFTAEHPGILGGVLDLVVAALRERRTIAPERLPRMATHVKNLHALDVATSGGYVAAFEASQRLMRRAQVDRDPLLGAVADLLDGCPDGRWTGTASELLDALKRPDDRTVPWPVNGRALSQRLNGIPDVLEAADLRFGAWRKAKRRGVLLERPDGGRAGASAGDEDGEIDLADFEAEARECGG